MYAQIEELDYDRLGWTGSYQQKEVLIPKTTLSGDLQSSSITAGKGKKELNQGQTQNSQCLTWMINSSGIGSFKIISVLGS